MAARRKLQVSEVLPRSERLFILRKRLVNLQHGAGDYSRSARFVEISRCQNAILDIVRHLA